jgi:hypothetical protein
MADAINVLNMLIPDGGWVLVGDEYEGIDFVQCEPITKAQFKAGFSKYDAWKAEQDATKATAKAAILDRIGLTADELKTILG